MYNNVLQRIIVGMKNNFPKYKTKTHLLLLDWGLDWPLCQVSRDIQPPLKKAQIFIENVRFNGEKITENLLKVASGLIIIW